MATGSSRASAGDGEPLRITFDTFALDEADARLVRSGRPVAVPPKAFAVLCALARQPGLLMTKNALLDAVWGHQFVSESVLKTTIGELRAALSDDARQPRYIETATRRGYRFIGKVTPSRASSATSAGLPPVRDADLVGGARIQATPMTGRAAALAQMQATWCNALGGRRQVMWVAGEAGVGKTTLIENFVAALGPIACGFGQCVEQYGAGEPYLPVLEALAMLSRNDAALAPLLRGVAPTWALQLPWLSSDTEREALRREMAGASQDRMLRELGELLDRYSQRQPILLVTEDLHWSDHATVRLIDLIARRRDPARLMWLATFRLAEVIAADGPLNALRHELRLHRLCDELVLDPFSERELADYIEQRFPGAAAPEAFVHALHARTDGLPLFVVNVIDDLVSQKKLQIGELGLAVEPALTSAQVPENLAGVIDKQIARLSAEQRTLLEAASVCGVEFRPGIAADALLSNPASVEDACEAMVRQQQWLSSVAVSRLPDGSLDARYAFRHALYRQVFYQRVGRRTRAQWHHRVAMSMERSRALGIVVSPAELASHFELGHDPRRALQHYADAAESALGHFAPTEAERLTTHALSLLPGCPDGAERHELELALLAPRGVACSQLFGVASAEARAAFERAQVLCDRLPPVPARASALSGLGWVFYTLGEYHAAHALAARMHALAESRDDRILDVVACNLLGTIVSYQGDLHGAIEWLTRGLRLCEAHGDELRAKPFLIDPEVSIRGNLCMPLVCTGSLDQARTQARAAQARAEALGQPMAVMLAFWCAGILEARWGDPERVLSLAESLRAVVARHGIVQGEGPARWLSGWARARLGEADAGHALILEGYACHARLGMLAGGTQVLGYAADALLQGGRWSDAHAQLDEALALATQIGERIFVPDLLLLRARAHLGGGHPGLARTAAREALREARGAGALGQEIDALVALCELDTPDPADFASLGDACARLQEGFQDATVVRARALLGASDVVVPPSA